MTDEALLLEFEMELAAEDKPLSTCPKCGWKTHRDCCPECTSKDGESLSLSGDTVIDEAMAKTADGEEFDLERALRFGEFTPVTAEDLKERCNE
jgi:uncharacterized OB-fold protein